MAKDSMDNKKLLREMKAELKRLQAALALAEKREGKDAYIDVRVKKNQGRFERIRQKGVEEKAVGKYHLELTVSAKEGDIFIPLSIASGKRVAGFMYQIEGTALGSLASADVRVRGEAVSQVTLGTLHYAKIPKNSTASFLIQATIRGKFGKTYKLVFTRLNYKRALGDARYEQYLKEVHSDSVTFN